MIELTDLLDAGASLLGPVRARKFSSFALPGSKFCPDALLIFESAADGPDNPVAAASERAAGGLLLASAAPTAEWGPTTLLAADPAALLARWIVESAARDHVEILLMVDGEDSAGSRDTRSSFVDLRRWDDPASALEGLVCLANALAQRSLGVRKVVARADSAWIDRLPRLVGARVDPGSYPSGIPSGWLLQHRRFEAFAEPDETAKAPTSASSGNQDTYGSAFRATVASARVSPERATWVSLDLRALAGNVAAARSIVGPDVAVMAVIKANAYGHGAAPISRTAIAAGASFLGVATLSEAVLLRAEGIAARILVLGYTPPWQADAAVAHDISVSAASMDVVSAIGEAALRLGRGPARIHVKVDTGMGRLGMSADSAFEFIQAATEVDGVDLEGVFTHFATADWADQTEARLQLGRFNDLLAKLDSAGLRPRLVHAANTAAIFTLPEAHFDMVRLGIGLYGLSPSSEVRCPPGFHPALRFTTAVAQVKELPPGHGVSYGRTFVTSRPTTIAVLPVGYGDGFRRSPRNWGSVLLHGREAPIVGVVCMDMCMVDVTEIPDVRAGDEAVLIGEQGQASLSAEEVATRLGTISYEVVTQILARVPREAWSLDERAEGLYPTTR